jgi:CHAT domain
VRTISYQDFDLLIECPGDGYRARVLNSPVNQAGPAPFRPPSERKLEDLVARMGRARPGLRPARPEDIQAFGAGLYRGLFDDDLETCLWRSLDRISDDIGLRIRLWLDCPELLDLPWEFLFVPGQDRFPGLSQHTPIVRYLQLPEAIRPLDLAPPLRMLVVISHPSDAPPLDAEGETAKLQEALAELEGQGKVAVEMLEEATLPALQRRLRRGEYHVLHFLGHGGYDEDDGEGVLVFEDEAGRARRVGGRQLGALLHDHRSLRLAVLNACEGGRVGRRDPFGGTAQALVRQGLPAVIAMQFEISDRAASLFSQVFYESVADGFPVDASLAEARKAIHTETGGVEWGTPVLYLRAPDGRVFDVAAPRPEAPAAVEPEAPSPDSLMKRAREAWALAATESDQTRRTTGLREAHSFLREAREKDPTNTEVLLLEAQLLVELTPEDPEDERRLLRAVRQMLQDPKDDIERLRLAHTLFLLGSAQDPPDAGLVQEARAMFVSLGRDDMVRRSDALLERGAETTLAELFGGLLGDKTKTQPAPVPPPGPIVTPPPAPTTPAPSTGVAVLPYPLPGPPALFGQWRLQDASGAVATFDLHPDGSFQSTAQSPLIAAYGKTSMSYQGRWMFDPFRQLVGMQGLLDGFLPYEYGFVIQGVQGPAYVGVDGTGTPGSLTRI